MTLPKIGFSIGDTNGIGLEVIIKSLLSNRFSNRFIPVIFGSPKIINYYRKMLSIDDNIFQFLKVGENPRPKKVNIFTCWEEEATISHGEVSREGGKFAKLSLEQAIESLKSKYIDSLITGPIHKKSMELAGFGFPGHTEYLEKSFPPQQSLMLMVYEDLRIGVVTGHIALHEVASGINPKAIITKAKIMLQSLKVDFGIEKPVIAVLGLNPHAGDKGMFGNEEENIIIPAINDLKKDGHIVMGPYPADGFFGSGLFKKFDGILAMYHDQGLVPFKTIAFGGGVNFTAGLPVVRTSPDHGTAFDIAGKNIANPSSLRHATYLALDILRNRNEYSNLVANRLISRKDKYEGEDEIIEDLEG